MTVLKMMKLIINFGVLDESAISEDEGSEWTEDGLSRNSEHLHPLWAGGNGAVYAAGRHPETLDEFDMQEIEIKLTEAQQKGKACTRTDSCTSLCCTKDHRSLRKLNKKAKLVHERIRAQW